MKKRFFPRKRFGQHFLHDENVTAMIVNAFAPKPDDHLVEIGPGLGALTTAILAQHHQLDAIELDRDVIPILKKKCLHLGELTIHQADVLAFDFSQLVDDKKPLRLIGNLPYNISTPLLFHLIEQKDFIQDMHFMLQKEVVDRITATVNSAAYGRLSVMMQYHCMVEKLFIVGPEAFSPPPKVQSAVIRLIPYAKVPYPASDYTNFTTVVRQAFSQRRKTLRNALKSLVTTEQLEQLHINPQMRPEQLSVEEYVKIANVLALDSILKVNLYQLK